MHLWATKHKATLISSSFIVNSFPISVEPSVRSPQVHVLFHLIVDTSHQLLQAQAGPTTQVFCSFWPYMMSAPAGQTFCSFLEKVNLKTSNGSFEMAFLGQGWIWGLVLKLVHSDPISRNRPFERLEVWGPEVYLTFHLFQCICFW